MSETAKIDTLELNIKTNADKAAEGIENLSTAVEHLKEASKGYGSKIKKIYETIESLSKQVDGIKGVTKANEELAKSTEEVGEAAKNTINEVKEVGESAKKTGENARESSKGLGKFFQNLKRIAVYRLIRSALKAIKSAFKEGISNLYQFSTLVNGQFSQSMDSLTSSLGYLKNTLGAFLANFIEAFEPIITLLIDGFAKVIEQISKFIALLFGKDYYYKATKSALKYADAINEVKNQLMGFDELNVLNSNGTTSNYGSMFEIVPLENAYATEVELKLENIKVNTDIVTAKLKQSQEGAKTITAIATALFGAIKGFQLTKNLVGAGVGAIVGFTLGMNLIETIADIVDDGSINKEDLNRRILDTLGSVIEAAGFALFKGHPVAGAVVFTVGAVIRLLVSDAFVEFKENVANNVAEQLSSLESIQSAQQTTQVLGAYGLGISSADVMVGTAIGEELGKKVFKKANGGSVNTGSLFWAGENGAELVTQVGSKSTVFNEDQLTVHLESANTGVIQAISALNANVVSAINKKNTSINVNDVRLATNSQNMRYAK